MIMTLKKALKDDINRWRDIPSTWVGRINIVKMTILPNASTDSMQSLSNYQCHFSQNQNKNFIIHVETQKTQIAKAVQRKNNEGGRINLPDFRLYYKTTIIRKVWYWHKNRNIDQWNKRKPRNKPMNLWVPYI